MRAWEHMVVEIHYDALIKKINEIGLDGWELVQVGRPYEHIPTDANRTMYHVVWFKRVLERTNG